MWSCSTCSKILCFLTRDRVKTSTSGVTVEIRFIELLGAEADRKHVGLLYTDCLNLIPTFWTDFSILWTHRVRWTTVASIADSGKKVILTTSPVNYVLRSIDFCNGTKLTLQLQSVQLYNTATTIKNIFKFRRSYTSRPKQGAVVQKIHYTAVKSQDYCVYRNKNIMIV